jgi:hypothetical protein
MQYEAGMLPLLRSPLLAAAVMRPGTEAVTFPSDEDGTGTHKLQEKKYAK